MVLDMKNATIKIKQFFSLVTTKILPICLRYRNNCETMNISKKKDSTLLTDADIEIQSLIVKLIKNFDKDAYIIAEEDENLNNPSIDTATSVWIVDPIDGTAQFTNLTSREYCIAICKYEQGNPIASLIIMPQLGFNFTPIIAETYCNEKLILINNMPYDYSNNQQTKCISCTRSKGKPAHIFEENFLKDNYTLKTSTTSQSIDLLRTACDLTRYSDLPLYKFDFFYRRDQKIWDGAPGFCFNYTVGNIILNESFKTPLPFSQFFLSTTNPMNSEIFVGIDEALNKLKQRKLK